MLYKILALITVFFAFGFTHSKAKSYKIPTIKVEVSINDDGSVHITEHLTYQFDESFSWAQYQLPRRGFTSISDITISEGGTPYINKNSEDDGTFQLARNDDQVRLKWHFGAKDEQRTFTISYTLKGALTVGNAWSEFFWNFLSSSRDKSTDHFNAVISLPYNVPADSLHGWTRGGGENMQLAKSDGSFKIQTKNIDDDNFAKVRVLFPTSIFKRSAVSVNDQQFTLTQAKSEEQQYQQQQKEDIAHQSFMRNLWGKLNYVIALLSILICYFLYQKYGKRHPTSRFSTQVTIMIPDRNPPAVIGWFMQARTIGGNLMMATVLDLARRGYFMIEEHPPEDGFMKSDKPTFKIQQTEQSPQSDLTGWEHSLLTFVEKHINENGSRLDKLFSSNSSELRKWMKNWRSDFKDYCFDKEWVDQQSYKGAYWNGGLQLLGICFSIPAVVFAGPIALISLFTTSAAFILSFAIIRRTEKGERIYHQWLNYRNGLKNAKEYSLSTDKLGRHFIYAIALGLKGKMLEDIMTGDTETMPTFLWFTTAANTNSAAAMASSFSTLGATGSASFSGAVGGAGASAGSAGGGASASAG